MQVRMKLIMDGFFVWAFAFVVVASLPFLGQVVGYISYRLIQSTRISFAHLVGAVVPPVAFLIHFKLVMGPAGFDHVEMLIALSGTAFQLLFSCALQLALHKPPRRRVRRYGRDCHHAASPRKGDSTPSVSS